LRRTISMRTEKKEKFSKVKENHLRSQRQLHKEGLFGTADDGGTKRRIARKEYHRKSERQRDGRKRRGRGTKG